LDYNIGTLQCSSKLEKLTKVYERIIRKYQQVDQGIKSITRHIKLVIATIPPKDLIQTLLKYPHKSEKIETITRDHQTSYENFVCRINEELNMKQAPPEKLKKPVSTVTTRQFPLH
jgi:hypothetical protein